MVAVASAAPAAVVAPPPEVADGALGIAAAAPAAAGGPLEAEAAAPAAAGGPLVAADAPPEPSEELLLRDYEHATRDDLLQYHRWRDKSDDRLSKLRETSNRKRKYKMQNRKRTTTRREALLRKTIKERDSLKQQLRDSEVKRGPAKRYLSVRGGYVLATQRTVANIGSNAVGICMRVDIDRCHVTRWEIR